MRAKWMGVAVAAVMGCGSAGGAQRAEASLLGDTLNLAYYYPDLMSEDNRGTITPSNFDVSPGILSFLEIDALQATLDYSTKGSTETLSFTISGTGFMAVDASFNGFVLTDLTAPDFDSVFLVSGIRADRVTSTGDQLQVNLQSLTYFPGDVISITFGAGPTPSVPLPASAPLFGAALLALGGIGYASRRGKAMTS